MADISSSLILLTYKGKILLMHKKSGAMDEEAHPWCFIGGIRKNKESYEAAMSRKVKEEMEVTLREAGEQAAFDVGVHGIHSELIKLIGDLSLGF